MSLLSRFLAHRYKLPPAETYDLVIERDVQVTMPDGAVLLGERTFPRSGGKLPTILLRSPYGRSGLLAELMGVRLFAERGFNVFMQSCRGTGGSGGRFDPLRQERDDGLATIAWLKRQPWFSGAFAMHGLSYLGYVQWAVAQQAGPELKALSTVLTAANFPAYWYRGEGFELEAAFDWTTMMAAAPPNAKGVGTLRPLVNAVLGRDPLQAYWSKLPLESLDQLATGERTTWWSHWLAHSQPAADGWWDGSDFHQGIGAVTAPVYLMAGWHDIFLPLQLADYTALIAAGRKPRLTIGPWTHGFGDSLMSKLYPESLAWLLTQLKGDANAVPDKPVRVFVMGAEEWREYESWPPDQTRPERWYLHADQTLSRTPPPPSEPCRYRYDPADPTPAVGGARLPLAQSGWRDNCLLEARADVLSFTSAPFEQNYEVIGAVEAELYVGSNREHSDFFVRICDVDLRGRSTNVCDGYQRLRPGRYPRRGDGIWALRFTLFPTAYRFKCGHRLRVQLSSGAHPRFARNLGTGEALGSGTAMLVADQEVYCDPARSSAIVLPIGLVSVGSGFVAVQQFRQDVRVRNVGRAVVTTDESAC